MAFKMEDSADEAASVARTREAFANRNDAFNDLRNARVENAAVRLQRINAQTDNEQVAAARALENGDWADHAQRQRRLSELAAERSHVEREHQYFESQPVHPRDPVEALIQSKSSEPETVTWLRAHPADALALATGSNPARAAKLQAAHYGALGEGHASGSKEYFRHVDRFLGEGSGSSGRQPGKRVVRVVREGQSAHGDDELTPGEYRAATEDVCWGNENPAKRGQPLGVEEYLRRRNSMKKIPGYYDKLD